MSFVWRHMCFRSEAEKTRYQTEELTLEDVFARFEADLRRRGTLSGERLACTREGAPGFGRGHDSQ